MPDLHRGGLLEKRGKNKIMESFARCKMVNGGEGGDAENTR